MPSLVILAVLPNQDISIQNDTISLYRNLRCTQIVWVLWLFLWNTKTCKKNLRDGWSQFLQELATEWPGTLLNLRLTCKRSPPPWFASSSPSSLSSLLKSSSSPPCSGLQHLRVRTRRCCVHVQAADEDAQQPSQGQGGQGVHLRGLPEHQLRQVGQVLWSDHPQTWNLSKKIIRPNFWAKEFYTLKTRKMTIFVSNKTV